MALFRRKQHFGSTLRGPHDLERRRLIAQFGWMVLRIPDDVPWGYSIGFFHTFKQPEMLIAGLPLDDIHGLCNRYGNAVKEGCRFEAGDVLDGWLESGESLMLIVVDDCWKPEFMGVAVDDYATDGFPALQAVWSSGGNYPWDPGWPEHLNGCQFLLGDPVTLA